MPYYECTLTQYLHNDTFEKNKLDKIFINLIGLFQTIHTNMIIHRDIKPDNFMIRDGNIYLIDFGFSTFYIQEDGFHSENKNIGVFNWNAKAKLLASIHCGDSPSRRDDLISLLCLFAYAYERVTLGCFTFT